MLARISHRISYILVCVRVCVCVCTSVQVHAHGAQEAGGGCRVSCSILRQVSYWTRGWADKQRVPETFLALPSAELRVTVWAADLSAGGLNSGPQACTARPPPPIAHCS